MATEASYVRKRVLFVCMGNCVRSQMAEALARHLASDVILPESAGIHPLGFIDPTTLEVLKEEGIPCDGQYSKGLRNSHVEAPDLIVNMSGLPGKGLFHSKLYEDWHVQDPFGQGVETHRRIFSDIRDRITTLADRFRAALAET